MSFVNLSKEQKQYLILGAIVAVALAILIVFGIKISLSSISEAKLELQDLTEKIERGEKSLKQSQRQESEFRSTVAELTAHLANLPPSRNYYSWATEIVYAEARRVHFEIDAINEISIATKEGRSKDLEQVELESYALRITAHGGYDNVKRFLQRIAHNHPLVRVTGIEISTGSSPDIHDVQLFMAWPFNLDYITESWKNMPAKKREFSGQEIPDPAPSSGPAHESEAEASAPEKIPTPPTPRTESTPKPIQTAPTALASPTVPVAEGRPEATGATHDK